MDRITSLQDIVGDSSPPEPVAWTISEEPFFKEWDQHVFDLLKLRASYGQTGTENGVNRFGYLSTYSLDEKKIVIGGKLQSGFSEGALVSPELLSWYQVNSFNLGWIWLSSIIA